MTPSDFRDIAIVAMVALAPISLVAIIALIRGYSIHIHMRRERGRRDDE